MQISLLWKHLEELKSSQQGQPSLGVSGRRKQSRLGGLWNQF